MAKQIVYGEHARGAILRGILLGLLLSAAVWKIAMIASDARLFRYQGF